MWILVIIALFASNAGACGEDCEEHQGVCACTQEPERPIPAQEIQPSKEKPRKEQQAEWQTGNVKADMPHSMSAEDERLDKEKATADFEGKRAAGLN